MTDTAHHSLSQKLMLLVFTGVICVGAIIFISDNPLLDHSPSRSVDPLTFRTEPTFEAANINFTIYSNPHFLSPGYIFIAPWNHSFNWRPQIFSQDGNLVYYGQGLSKYRVNSFGVCDWKEETHLCFTEREVETNQVLNKVIDDGYKEVEEIGIAADLEGLDGHEFKMLPGGYAYLQPACFVKVADLSQYKGEKNGSVRECCFQEVDVESREELFHWCYLDHYTIQDAHDPELWKEPEQKAPPNSWDILHINSVDKNFETDYLVSFRHLDQILKIAGTNNLRGLKPGSTIWRLGGFGNDFKQEEDAKFRHQHDARFVKTSSDEEVISLFNNGERHAQSNGLILGIHNRTMEAHAIQSFGHPYGGHSPAQGSMRVLPNGNALVGWGGQPEYSEFSGNGTLLVHGIISQGPVIYRTYKNVWNGYPTWKPKLIAYAENCIGPVIAYMSWNGATELTSWRVSFYDKGNWSVARVFNRTGFETRVQVSPRFASQVKAEALDSNAAVLDFVVATTFVPARGIKPDCDADGCFGDDYDAEHSMAGICATSFAGSTIALFVSGFLVESLELLISHCWTV